MKNEIKTNYGRQKNEIYIHAMNYLFIFNQLSNLNSLIIYKFNYLFIYNLMTSLQGKYQFIVNIFTYQLYTLTNYEMLPNAPKIVTYLPLKTFIYTQEEKTQMNKYEDTYKINLIIYNYQLDYLIYLIYLNSLQFINSESIYLFQIINLLLMYHERKENEAIREGRKHAAKKMRRDKSLKLSLKMKILIPITRSEYKINKGKFYLRLFCPFTPSQITKLALNQNAGSPSLAGFNTHRSSYLNRFLNNLADRNIASLIESLAPTRWGQIKHEFCLSLIMLLYKTRYIIYKATIYSTIRTKSKRKLDTARSNDSEIQPPLHPRARVNHHQRVEPQWHAHRDVGHVQLLKEAPHRTRNYLILLVQILTSSSMRRCPTRAYSRSSTPSPPLCPQFLSL